MKNCNYFTGLLLLFFLKLSSSTTIDSLKIELQKAKTDSNLISLYTQIYKQYKDSILDSALHFANKGLEVAVSSNNKKEMSYAYYNLQYVYKNLGQLDKALECTQKYFELSKELGKNSNVAGANSIMGVLHYLKEDYTESLEYYLGSLKIYEDLKDTFNCALVQSFIGEVYISQKDYINALHYFNTALSLFNEINNKKGIAKTYGDLGSVHFYLENDSLSEYFLLKSINLSKELNQKSELVRSYCNLGGLYLKKKQWDLAKEYFEKMNELNKVLNNRIYSIYYLIGMSNVYRNTNHINNAIENLLQSEILSKKYNFNLLFNTIYYDLANLYKLKGKYSKAFQYMNLYAQEKDSVFNKEKTTAINELMFKYNTEKKNAEIELLKKNDEINQLQISEQKASLAKQQILIVVISLVIALLILVYILNRREQQRKIIEQEKQQLALEKKMIELEQKALQSQMNPHFIFNALNSIQSFITSNDTLQAAKFLTKFSKLMRLILESSREQMIVLEDEIKMIEYYLEIQQLCYGKKFDFKIEVDEQLEADEIKIPPMLVQPYIENAIIHGILNKETTGTIIVRFTKRDDLIHVEVEDNGVGREQASVLKKHKGEDFHKSVGLLITQERIEMFNKEHAKHISTEIIDQKDSNNFSMGTKAIISFPLYS